MPHRANKKGKRLGRPTLLDAIICGAFQYGVSRDQLARKLVLTRARVEDGIRRGRLWGWRRV